MYLWQWGCTFGLSLDMERGINTFNVELESKPILEHYIEDNGSTTISSFTASSAGRGISNKILQEHKRIVSRIQSEVSSDIEVKAEYSVVMNGFAVKAKYGDLEDIRQIKGVKSAFVASTYEVPTNPEIDLEPFTVNSNKGNLP